MNPNDGERNARRPLDLGCTGGAPGRRFHPKEVNSVAIRGAGWA
jgi:hypothetical protein